MSDSVLKQELPEHEKTRIVELAKLFGVCDGGRYLNDWITKADQFKALKAEIKNLTLLSDSQLANQERLTEELDFMRQLSKSTLPCGHLSHYGFTENGGKTGYCTLCELATERANQERLVGEMWIDVNQELPAKKEIVDVWVQGVQPFRVPNVRYEWNGGTEGFWDWHYADESDIREGEPLQMYGFEPDDVTHWMTLPKPPALLALKDTPTEPTQEK